MASKTRKPKLSQEEKSRLAILKKKGLYSPKNPRAPNVKYAKSLLKKFRDVWSGTSAAVATDAKTATKYHREDAKPGEVRSKGRRVIVPVHEGDKVKVNKREHTIETVRHSPEGDKYERIPFSRQPHSFDDIRDQMSEGDRVTIGYNRGKGRALGFHQYTLDEFQAAYFERYQAESDRDFERRKSYALEFAQIFRFESAEQAAETEAAEHRREARIKQRTYRAKKRQGAKIRERQLKQIQKLFS